tara:strand:- start:862 stop:1734 length:873 start_codon:yes stop_codon:yes gene_type:complete
MVVGLGVGASILARLGVPVAKTSSTAVARWSALFVEDQILKLQLAEGVEAEIILDFDNAEAEQTFFLAFLVNGCATAWTLKNIPKAQQAYRLAQLAYVSARQAGASRGSALLSSRVAGKGIAFGLGKLLVVDTAIWVGTMSIDGILNFFMEEEDQGWFADMWGGWSPLGEAIDRLGVWLGIWPDEEEQVDYLAQLIEEASDSPTLAGAITLAMTYFLENTPEVKLNIDQGIWLEAQADAYMISLQESFSFPAEEVWENYFLLVMEVVMLAVGARFLVQLGIRILNQGSSA